MIINHRKFKIIKKSVFTFGVQENIKYRVTTRDLDDVQYNSQWYLPVQGKPTCFWKKSDLFFICNMSQRGSPRKGLPTFDKYVFQVMTAITQKKLVIKWHQLNSLP